MTAHEIQTRVVWTLINPDRWHGEVKCSCGWKTETALYPAEKKARTVLAARVKSHQDAVVIVRTRR